MPVADLEDGAGETEPVQFVGGVVQDVGPVVAVRRGGQRVGRPVVVHDMQGADGPAASHGQLDGPVERVQSVGGPVDADDDGRACLRGHGQHLSLGTT